MAVHFFVECQIKIQIINVLFTYFAILNYTLPLNDVSTYL